MSDKDNNEWAYNIRSYIEDSNLDDALIGLLEKIETLIDASNTRSNQISELNERIEKLEKEIKMIELQQLNRARLGAIREFQCLYNIWNQWPKKYTREEMDTASEEEYKIRLLTQANQDMATMGSVSQGNQEGLRQIGMDINKELADKETKKIKE